MCDFEALGKSFFNSKHMVLNFEYRVFPPQVQGLDFGPEEAEVWEQVKDLQASSSFSPSTPCMH